LKTKIVGILVCMLLIATMAIPTVAINRKTNNQQTSTDADVPEWEVGDSWTYELHYFQNGDMNESYSFEVIGDITYEVMEDTGDTYVLEGTTGEFDLVINIGRLVLKPTRFMTIGTELEIQKSDLALVQWHQFTKGLYLPWVGPIPLPVPVQVEAVSTTTFDPSWIIIPFPLYDGKTGTLDAVEFTDTGKTALYWGLITIYDGENTWGWSGLDYTCYEEQVTVPAGIYTAYNVSAEYPDYDCIRSYYVEEVGNSVKQLIHIQFSNHVTYYYMAMELKSTTYTP